jgi:hypothetical protein
MFIYGQRTISRISRTRPAAGRRPISNAMVGERHARNLRRACGLKNSATVRYRNSCTAAGQSQRRIQSPIPLYTRQPNTRTIGVVV